MNEIMISVDVAAEQLAELVEAIHARGHTAILTKNGRPLARLVPLLELRSGADLANFVHSDGSEPPLPEAGALLLPDVGAPPLAHQPPLPAMNRPPLPRAHESRTTEQAQAIKKAKPTAYIALSIVMAVLAGVMVLLLVALVVRFALLPAPIPTKPPARPGGRDTSYLIPPAGAARDAVEFERCRKSEPRQLNA